MVLPYLYNLKTLIFVFQFIEFVVERTIEITIGIQKLKATLDDSLTSDVIYTRLPVTGTVKLWGKEVYFPISVEIPPAPYADTLCQVGDIAYWPGGPMFCLFWGETPASNQTEPRAVSPVNVFGKIDEEDLPKLDHIKEGEFINVKQV
jgi:hypothetical protein